MITFSIVGWELPYNNLTIRRCVTASYGLTKENASDDTVWNALLDFAGEENSPLLICEATKQMFFGVLMVLFEHGKKQNKIEKFDINIATKEMVKLSKKVKCLNPEDARIITGILTDLR